MHHTVQQLSTFARTCTRRASTPVSVGTRLATQQRSLHVSQSSLRKMSTNEESKESCCHGDAGNGDRPAHHHPSGRFCNPWPSFVQSKRSDLAKFLLFHKWPPVPPAVPAPPSVPMDHARVAKGPPQGALQVTWLGHATFLIRFPNGGPTVLTDPICSERCSPVQWAGPRRYLPPPCTVAELPDVIDAVIISHNHYDHVDLQTVTQLAPRVKQWFVPLGLKAWFDAVPGVVGCVELDWWSSGKCANTTFTCTPAQHFSGRTLLDRDATLWASWSVAGDAADAGRFYFGGDTGYRSVPKGCPREEEATLPHCPAFAEIGDRLGPFDLGLIPIGAYEPRHVMSPVHLSPEDAVCVHRDVRSRHSIGMHWGTFVLTTEPIDEPPRRLKEAAAAAGLAEDEFVVIAQGETVDVAVVSTGEDLKH